jgi:SAM-dependent methyltransferase
MNPKHGLRSEFNIIEAEAERSIIRSWIRPGGSCLELGGGVGRITRALEPLFAKVVMVDISRQNLNHAAPQLDKTHLIRSDISYVPAADSSFDYVIMLKVVHLLRDPSSVFEEIFRVTRNRGILILSIPNLRTNYFVGQLERMLPRLKTVLPVFGPAVWPLGERPYSRPDLMIVPKSFRLEDRRGTGLFDNYLGKALSSFRFLHLVDVATSPLWFFKPEVLYRFQVLKIPQLETGGGVEGTEPDRTMS